MKRREMLIKTGAAALGLGLSGFPMGWMAGADAPKRRLLFFTKSSGFEHGAIKRNGNELGLAERTLIDMGAKNGFEVTATKDGRVLMDGLNKYDTFVFYTTGNLTEPGTDKNAPMTPEGKAAFLDAIKKGKGFFGFHSATDTFHSPGDRYQDAGDKTDPYIRMIGGEFISHGAQQLSKMTAVDTKFPGFGGMKDGFEMMEEWYSFNNFAKDLHVLLAQETQGMKGNMYQRASYPATWARMHGKGRVFYTSMGHRDDVWTNPIFQSIVLGGLSWTTGNAKADVKPNVDKVTPKYQEIPPKGR